jgi:hypothetical protein
MSDYRDYDHLAELHASERRLPEFDMDGCRFHEQPTDEDYEEYNRGLAAEDKAREVYATLIEKAVFDHKRMGRAKERLQEYIVTRCGREWGEPLQADIGWLEARYERRAAELVK